MVTTKNSNTFSSSILQRIKMGLLEINISLERFLDSVYTVL